MNVIFSDVFSFFLLFSWVGSKKFLFFFKFKENIIGTLTFFVL